MANRRPGEQFSPEVYQSARALALLGDSSRRIVAKLRQSFPGERIPDYQTVLDWRTQDYTEQEIAAANQAHIEILRRTQTLVLERLDTEPEKLSALQLHTLGAISHDKLLSTQRLAQDKAQPSVIVPIQIVLNAPSTDLLDVDPATQT